MKGDVINNKHPRFYNPTRTTHKCWTLLDSTPKDKENLAINGFVSASQWAKGYPLSKRRILNRSG
jgi:hypothetical protein